MEIKSEVQPKSNHTSKAEQGEHLRMEDGERDIKPGKRISEDKNNGRFVEMEACATVVENGSEEGESEVNQTLQRDVFLSALRKLKNRGESMLRKLSKRRGSEVEFLEM